MLKSINDLPAPQSLPDILWPHLSVIFCGINPGMLAASTGHHFAGRNNRFWRVVHLAGFTSTLLGPEHDRSFLRYGCGPTTAVPRPTARADQLTSFEIKAAAAAFEQKIRQHAPQYIASSERWRCPPSPESGISNGVRKQSRLAAHVHGCCLTQAV